MKQIPADVEDKSEGGKEFKFPVTWRKWSIKFYHVKKRLLRAQWPVYEVEWKCHLMRELTDGFPNGK